MAQEKNKQLSRLISIKFHFYAKEISAVDEVGVAWKLLIEIKLLAGRCSNCS